MGIKKSGTMKSLANAPKSSLTATAGKATTMKLAAVLRIPVETSTVFSPSGVGG